jgi:pyrroloquinoline quinone (PQQ) biosynthesis protein C
MGLKQSEIQGLSERQVRRIEKGEGTTYEALRRLAAAHGMDLEPYLRELAVNASERAMERAIA